MRFVNNVMKTLWLHFFLLCSILSFGQKKYKLHFHDESYKVFVKNPSQNFKDSLSAKKYLTSLQQKAIQKGYLLASIDSIRYGEKTMTAFFFVGERYSKACITFDAKEQEYLEKQGVWSEKRIRTMSFNPKEMAALLTDIQQAYENNGYPFCKLQFDSILIDKGTLNAHLNITPFSSYRFTKIHLVGNPPVSEKLIASYIQIKAGDVYSRQKINEISGKLKLISFVQEVKPAELLFTKEGVELFLYIKTKPVSLANGVVGIQQDPVKGTVFLTGELRLKLVNALKKAEAFDLHWRSIQVQTSSLKINAVLPNLFQTPFGFDGQFSLYKRDSTFLELKTTLGVQYALKQGNFLKVFYRKNASSVLNGAANNPNFSNLKSVETNFYGLAFSRQQVDYLPNPTKGLLLYLDGTIGSRTVKDSTDTKPNLTFQTQLNCSYFIPLAKRHVLRLANVSELYFAPTFYENEVFRFGGQISLRGFNEEDLKATSRTVGTLEYRFLLDQNSYLFAFYDQAWYENKSKTFVTDTPFGFGAGLAFGTTIGNFSVSYALGSQQGNPILLRDGKVHFGYIAYF